MEENQQPYQRKWTLQRLWQRICRTVSHFLIEILLPGVGHIGTFLSFVVAFPVVFLLIYPIILVFEIRERCRRHCPFHKERFRYETVTICPEEAEINRQSGVLQPKDSETYYIRQPREPFRYANDSTSDFTKAKTFRRRYCLSCREAKAYYREVNRLPKLSPEERAQADAAALRQLEELEQQLGLVAKRPEQVLDETTGNQKAETGDL